MIIPLENQKNTAESTETSKETDTYSLLTKLNIDYERIVKEQKVVLDIDRNTETVLNEVVYVQISY